MRRSICGWTIGVGTALAVAVPHQAAFGQGGPRVIITEIMYNPNSNEKNSETEWVEIANVGSESINIKDWRLDDEDKQDWGKFSCTLAPGGVAVLVNADFVKEEQFRAAWDPPHNSPNDPPPPNYQVIPVKWANLANAPDADNEVLHLLNDKGETVCEVRQEGGPGVWPQITKPDGPSIYLTDITASNLNDGKLWKKSAVGVDGAHANTKTDIFNGADIGSPGVVPGLSGAPAASGKPVAAASQPTSKPANKIDY